jgi:hypothetical protein
MEKKIISETRLREIISEEATRMKKRLTLESEKKTLLKRLQEMYGEDASMDNDGITDDGASTEVNKDEIADQTIEIANTLSPDQMKMVIADLQKAGLLGKSEEEIETLLSSNMPMAEGVMTEALSMDSLKKFLQALGIIGAAASVVALGVGGWLNDHAMTLADFSGATLKHGWTSIVAAIAASISGLSMVAQSFIKGQGITGDDVKKREYTSAEKAQIARRKAMHGR